MGNYVAPSSPSETGRLTLEFTAPDRGTLTWPGGTIPIQRHVFALGEATFQPTGWWWTPDESGRGFSIEVQGDTLFLAAFMYDTSGNPIWYISSGKLSTPRTYAGTLVQVSGGQTMGGSYRPPAAQVPIGSVEIEFASEDAATITLSDRRLAAHAQAAEAGTGSTINALPGGRRVNIVRQMAQPGPLQAAPRYWAGEISKTHRVSTPERGSAETSVRVADAKWQRISDDGRWPATYRLIAGIAEIAESLKGPGCEFFGEGQVALPNFHVYLYLFESGRYKSWQLESETTISMFGNCAGNPASLPETRVSVDFQITESALWRGRMVGYLAPLP
jgi:hypothetical protein